MCVCIYRRLSDESDIYEGFLACGGGVVALPWLDIAIRAEIKKQLVGYAPATSISLRNSCSSPSPHCQVLAELTPKYQGYETKCLFLIP